MISSAGRARTPRHTWFPMDPVGTNSPASFPRRSAAYSCNEFTVGSSPNTSSPTGASAIALRISGVGRVTVSERRSMRSAKENLRCCVERWIQGLQGSHCVADRNPDDVGPLQGHHLAVIPVVNRIDGGDPESGRQDPVESGRSATALDMPEDGHSGLETGSFLDLPLEHHPDP